MKLLKKANKTYLIISAIAFTVAGVVICFVISFFFQGQINEKLLSDKQSVIRSIEKNNSLPDFYPFVEVKMIQDKSKTSVSFCDTLIFDLNENENVLFRQLSSVVAINGKMYRIIIRDTLLEKSEMMMIIGIVIWVIFILLIIVLYLINEQLSLRIWQPFYKTLDDLRKFSQNAPDFKITSVSEIDEFSELNRTLEELTSKVISDYQSLKRFTEDASHEIQTPLAIIQSKLETMLQNPELKKEQAELINSACSSVYRISKLTQSLILLTKIANDQFKNRIEINFSNLVDVTIELFEDQIKAKSLNLKKEINSDCFLETNQFLAESMIINLIGNAVKHCITGGKIYIRLEKCNLEISNSGIPLTVPSSKLFERFFKINPSSESQGLGLSIVSEICALNGWIITYQFVENLHKFNIRF